MIFLPNYINTQTTRVPLTYVQPFQFAQKSKKVADAGINMYSLIHNYWSDNTRRGLIVPLSQIWQPVELIPKFHKQCNKDWTCDTAVELAREFYLNCYSDKATYLEVY